MEWPLTFLYTQVAIVNNTKLSSPGEGKLPLKLAVIEIEPRLSFQTWSSPQLYRWKDARSETADIFFEGIAAVWNEVRQALRCLAITCLCMLSFQLDDFSQTEQNQLMSTSQEQSVDREKGRMLRIYIPPPPPQHFYCFLPPSPPSHFYCFLFPPPPHFYIFSLRHYHHISIVFFLYHLRHISIFSLQVIL